MRNFRSVINAAVLMLALSLAINADEITLKNGDRVTGKIVDLDGRNITIETEFAGTIRIDAAHIETVSLVEGATPTTAKTVIEAPKNKTDIPARPADLVADAPAKKAEPAKPNALKPIRRLFEGRHFGLTSNWEGNINIGFSYTDGNSRTSTMTTSFRAVKSGHRDQITVYTRSLWNSNRRLANRTTSNAVWGGIRYDRNATEKMFGFVSYDFERDRPKLLNFRSVVGGGGGMHAVKSDRTEWDLMLGGAWNTAWQVGQNTSTPEATAASSFKHRFGDRIKLQKTFTFYQDVTALAKYRFIFDSTLSADLTKRIGWFVTIGDRYNNFPIGNTEKNDVLFTTGIKWNFGKKAR